MSFLLLNSGTDAEGVSRDFGYSWAIFDEIYEDFTYKWAILDGIIETFTYKWAILSTVYNQFIYKWSVRNLVQRDYTYIWNVATDFGTKVKYAFISNPITTRFFRRNRLG